MFGNKQPHNLTKLIAMDLITIGRVPFVLLVIIVVSAMGVVFTTHHTRDAITTKDLSQLERERLDNEWRNLILEENALAEHSRVQSVAAQELEMIRPDGNNEVVISIK